MKERGETRGNITQNRQSGVHIKGCVLLKGMIWQLNVFILQEKAGIRTFSQDLF